ncbi:type VI secretion system membrane subunit TssM [Methylococcus sp. EFPC2]|uniref:type VI secretion system membrane subunit TssM n=1 Tax=Methylococcus sp. EFPC2 TaxID=2812648 RepID=UPI00196714F3|nr:type VI secretion system membrane subunit TssM [Methylococcus sp. EFPC2]QSA96407.1 type VI secretion system membrane subunit TssM [Methylococcus sp. EFPC2]
MSRIIAFFKNPWVIQFLGLLALAALIWFAGPLIAIAGTVPLESALARGLTIAFVVVAWVIYRLIRQIQAGRKDGRLMNELAASGAEAGKSVEAEATEEEAETLQRGFAEALEVLKQSRAKGADGKQFLYELPWYAIIGAPGSGKTTALINSGLKFPLAERLGKHAVRGVSGTRNCDWWFTDEAVLLDTAGRYTTQDSHQAVDAAAWLSFLGLIKKYRPRRPLNGLLVTLSLHDLLLQTEEERALHAAAIRRRVQELYEALGVRLPIYLLFTKTDLVAGFTDFFADLSQDERAQVWGETFPAEDPDRPADCALLFETAYDELLQRLNKRTFKRVQDERDVQRRALILDYPQQMGLLKPAMTAFLQAAFAANRYDRQALLRGVYFTSGTQEGTPIDRVMGILAGAFRLDRQIQPVYSGRGKSFFLTRLLKEVIFGEAGLAGIDPRVERRHQLIQVGAYAGVLLFAAGLIALWAVSYARNQAAIARVEEQLPVLKAYHLGAANGVRDEEQWGSAARARFKVLLPRLDALLAARDVYKDPGWLMGFGLYQGDKLQAAANHAYEGLLRDYFRPAVILRQQERMQGDESASPELLYQTLKVYLMLADPQRLDAKVVAPWVKIDWEKSYATEPDVQARLSTHLGNLLQLELEPAPVDENFVAAVRAKLTQVPQVLQLYGRFKTEALVDHAHDVKVAELLGPSGAKVFASADGKDLATVVVPGLYSAYGYTELFLKKSLGYIREAVEQNWVLGKQAVVDPAEIGRLHEDFKKLYLGDYQKAWSGLLSSLKLRPAQSINQTVEVLDVLARPDTPLRPLLEAVEKNTSLSKLSAAAADLLAKIPGKPAVAPDEQTQKLLALAKQASGLDSGAGVDPARSVENYFEGLNVLVRGGPDKPAPLNATLATLGALHDFVLQIGSAASSGDQALKTAANRVSGASADQLRQAQMEFSRLPEPLKTWLQSLTQFGWSQTLSGAKGQLNEMLKTGVAAQCKTAFAGRYPFNRAAAQEALLADFTQFFAPNGQIDQFFQTNLKTFIDTTRPEWRQLQMDNQSLGLSPAAIRQFQNASRIRDAFFPGGGQVPQVQFELKPLALDNNVATFRLSVEGQETVYRHGPEQVVKFQWPGPATNAGVRLVFETLDGRQLSRSKEGPWAWFRALDEATVEKTVLPDRFNLTFRLETYTARYELRAGSVNNPFNLAELQAFRCPESL